VCDSWEIAEYLEVNYPGEKSLFRGNKEAHFFFDQYVAQVVMGPLSILGSPKVAALLEEKAGEFYKRTRLERYGYDIDAWAKEDPEKQLQDLKKVLAPVHASLEKSRTFIFGEHVTYSDMVLLAHFLWIRVTDESLLERILGLFEGGLEREWFERCLKELHVDDKLSRK